MPVIARDTVASDHLVYAWPFPIGPEEQEVVCADDEYVVMCPAWVVGSVMTAGRHRWRTPDPMRPVHAFFVLTAPVEVSFDMVTMFIVPATGEGVRLRAVGSLQVRCTDASLLIAQFVGLPFDAVNEGILRSVSRSVERMLARLLTRRVVMAGTAAAVTDLQMQPHIVEELVAYNPAAGAVFGVELVRMGHLAVLADDGTRPLEQLVPSLEWSGSHRVGPNGDHARTKSMSPLTETIREPRGPGTHSTQPLPSLATGAPSPQEPASEPGARRQLATTTPPPIHPVEVEPPAVPAPADVRPPRASSQPPTQASGEIVVRPRAAAKPRAASPAATASGVPTSAATVAASLTPAGAVPAPKAPGGAKIADGTPIPPPPRTPVDGAGTPTPRLMASVPAPSRRAAAVEVPRSIDDITQPGVPTPVPGAMRIGVAPPEQPRGAIMGIGMAHAASSGLASGEISNKIAPGVRVLVPGPNGLMQSATVRQLLQGYYELEVGASGETIWVPITGVVPHE